MLPKPINVLGPSLMLSEIRVLYKGYCKGSIRAWVPGWGFNSGFVDACAVCIAGIEKCGSCLPFSAHGQHTVSQPPAFDYVNCLALRPTFVHSIERCVPALATQPGKLTLLGYGLNCCV